MRNFRIDILITLVFCFFLFEGNTQCTDQSNYWIESWTSCTETANPNSTRGNSYWLLFEFTEPQAISTTHFWNANRVGESGSGAKTVFIDVSTDGTTWSQVGSGSFIWPQASELDTYEGFDGPDLQSFGFIEKILVTFQDNHDNSSCVSVSELRFDIDETACYGEIDACGICDGPGMATYYEDADSDGLGNPQSTIEACVIPSGYVENNEDNCDNGLIGWEDVGHVFIDNGCTGCHGGSSPASNLDLNSYAGISSGGDICGVDILTGSVLVDIISIPNYDGCSSPIPFPSMNERVGGVVDADELLLLQTWIDHGALLDCNCPDGSPDKDLDGICDFSDLCDGLNDALIGTSCDDGDPCTIEEVITINCECVGIPAPDSDFDGVCDIQDLSPNDPCTADGQPGFPEPADWFANGNNDCDLDGITIILGDLNDYDECINAKGLSLNASCTCPEEEVIGGPSLLESEGIFNDFYAVGIPDGRMTGSIGFLDYLDLEVSYVEVGTEICFSVGFGDEVGGVQFEVNDLGYYKYANPNPSLSDFEIQVVCFPTFMIGPQKIRVSRYIQGAIRIDGASYEFCPCTESDPLKEFASCVCPDDMTEVGGNLVSSFGINNPEEANGLPDGIFSNSFASNDSMVLSYPAMAENYEICFDILFTEIDGRVSFDFNGENKSIVNPVGNEEDNETQTICIKTNSNEALDLVVKEIGVGFIYLDGSIARHCNPCVSDTDQDGVCDIDDLCLMGDDALDEDGDGIPDACDTCNANLIGAPCDDNDNCTYNDLYDSNCNCVGTPIFYESVNGLQGPQVLHAIDSISLTGDFEILSNGSYKAGKNISIEPGFETKEFMSLEIQIDNCSVDN